MLNEYFPAKFRLIRQKNVVVAPAKRSNCKQNNQYYW